MAEHRVFVDYGVISEDMITELANQNVGGEKRKVFLTGSGGGIGDLVSIVSGGSKDPPTAELGAPPVVVLPVSTAAPGGTTPVAPVTTAPITPSAPPALDAELNAKAKVIEEGLSALAWPGSIWHDITDKDARSGLALEIVAKVFEERAHYARAAAYVFAPELDLFERAKSDDLAKRVLEAREHITDQDVEKAKQDVEEAKQDVSLATVQVDIARERIELEHHRAALMKEVVGYANERVKHMKRWREISEFGPKVLIGSLAGAAAAIVYILLVLVPRGHVTGEVAALIIFTLAVFVTAPATLLLRERPLRGIDQFMPGGKADTPENGASASTKGAASGTDAAAADETETNAASAG